MRFVLDTDHISLIQRRSEPEFSAISARLAGCSREDLAYSIVSLHEQFLGGHAYIARARGPADVVRGYDRLWRIFKTFAEVSILPFDDAAATEFARLQASRVRVGTMDLRIASIALSRRLVLVTRNTRDFGKVPGLITADWTV
jgi:tRNA(fMet)-specific endonuclease VapC